ncbi:DUF4365 domain-containing protein [Streptomyces nigra]|uniref:DUF4365 domain-containing protein n=1 Tax=Streptomyces nigra TaxID=1827580 RepID=UPI0013DDCDB3|nr:DUF4365 domain-containing protein [Streptomyces nigra]
MTASKVEWDGQFLALDDGVPYGSLHSAECKQQFSLAYTHAITTAARCTISDLKVDVERIDFTVRQSARHKKYSSSQVDIQLKCTAQDLEHKGRLRWRLSRDHYDWLRDVETYNHKILVVVTVPKLLDEWLETKDDHLLLRKKAYWVCLEGMGEIEADSTYVDLPKDQTFDVVQLLNILHRVGNGERP